MSEPNYEPLPSELGKLFPVVLDVKVDGPFRRRIEDFTKEVSRETPDLPPVMWGIVLFAGFLLLRMAIRSEGNLTQGLRKLLADSLKASASGI